MPMYDTNSFNLAGIPLNKSMIKYGNAIDQFGNTVTPNPTKMGLNYDSVYAIMRQQNMIETLERYVWISLPPGLTADLIERELFFRGKGCFYYNDKVGKFQFLPFALNGVIDEYGRYLSCNTLPFTGIDNSNNDKFKPKGKGTQPNIYENLEIVYDLPYSEDMIKGLHNGKPVGIILNDSSLSISQQPIIRSNYVQPILHMMATLMQIINTAMYGASDHNLIQVESECEVESINNQIDAINFDILKGRRFTPIVDKLPITPIKTSTSADLDGLFNTFNSLNNFLKSITGVANAGVFNKEEHLLQSEQALNGSNADDIYYNGLRQRQEFCLLAQAYYGIPMWCESKRNTTQEQEEDYALGETTEPDTTIYSGGGNNV